MRKLWISKTIISIVIFALFAGCYYKNPATTESNSSDNTTNTSPHPFESDQTDTVTMGTISHRFNNLLFDEKGQALPLQYNGGELNIDYSVSASGKARNVGFLVFIDGVPQPYKVNTTEAPYEYMHIFELKEDDKDTPFTFLFSPVTGKKGDTLHVSVTSIYNPAFRPNMNETSSYGGYHDTLESGISLVFNNDPEEVDFSSTSHQQVLSNVEASTELITKELLEKNISSNKLNADDIGKKVFTQLLVNNEVQHQNYQVSKKGTLHVNFKMFGHPGVRYKNTFYLDHKALTYKDISSFETLITEGDVSEINAEINLENLEDFSTFYVVSVPINAKDFPDDVILLKKTPSLLLYK